MINQTSIEYLKDTFKIGYEAFLESKEESRTVWDMYHNRFYTEDQLDILKKRGQPAETFNVIKLFSRLLLGYYSTVVNTMSTVPKGMEDIPTVSLLNDVLDHVVRDNNFMEEAEKIKLSGMVSGVMCAFVNVKDTGERDEYGRPVNRVTLEHVPESELIFDPMSRRDDYRDARFIHRYKWVTEEAMLNTFGKKVTDSITEYYNFTDAPQADFEEHQINTFYGQYKTHNAYLIVHSVVVDEKGKSWSILWHDNKILKKDEITFRDVKFPYRVVFTHTSEETEYYGIYRDVIESQKSINQALIKLQLTINTQKAFVEQRAVENITDFTNAFNRVSAVIPVKELAGIRIENMSQEAQEQYIIVDRCLDRIQRILGINDSFLGMAYASDSGRKVKLQQNASIIALRYFTGRVESFYRFLGWDIINLVKQYYTATQALRIADDDTGYRWAELNQPLTRMTGQINPVTGMPDTEVVYEEVLDPATGEPMIIDGNYVYAPVPTEETDISFTNVDIEVTSNAYNDEDEKNQLMLETVLSGPTGQLLSQINPAGFFKAAGLSLKSVKTKNSPEIAEIFAQTAAMLQGIPGAEQEASMVAQGGSTPNQNPKSAELKLPQNTNEGL